jgi:hypothetical protein
MLVPGPWQGAPELIDGLRDRGIATDAAASAIHVEIVEDDQLAAGCAWGRDGPLPDDLLEAIDACSRAALIEVRGRLDECAPRVAVLGRALRELGGVAVRMEASGAASAWEPWLERLESGRAGGPYSAAVILVKGDGAFFTCGMHQFELPDAEIATDDPRSAVAWLDAFCVFQLAEQPALGTGHTFRPDAESERRALERWPDHRHHPDDGRHNPFGLWRLLPEGVAGLEPQDPVPTIIPPLVVLLAAAERSKGSALSRSEVERLVEDAPAITMAIPDALTMERSRGYADIEPRLAWEQWQIVRATLS